MSFCPNCGKEIRTNQKFCSTCGSENINYDGNSSTIITQDNSYSVKTNSEAFNRDVLNNYLNNLQTLEFAKDKLEQDEREITYRINSLGKSSYIAPKNTLLSYGSHFGGLVFMFIIFIVATWIDSGLNGNGFLSIFDFILVPLVSLAKIASVIISIVIIICIIRDHINDGKRFNEQTQQENNRLKWESAEKKRLLNKLPHIKNDLKKTTELLDQAYSINLIPAKYRNIYAIYYLYEYISTSTVSLNQALVSCDLDEISCKLDEIIDQQRRLIMLQARSNALNEQLVSQNEQILSYAIKTADNTALAAQYAQVSAVNTETISTIQSYHFFKEGW